ncbi:glycine zipper domain-containing protein [Anatilimnocola sp. NA78]|uniref:glycine zipper domain-containing protein n=1 Tax=Anatilimnocola sp. NA78 TaxID=3415683 RepID=UPI003CE50E31
MNGFETNRKRETDMKSLVILLLSVGVTLSTVVSAGCQTPNYQRNGTVLGGLTGAGLGAAIGNKSQNALAGGLIGGAVGAITGNAIGQGIDQDRQQAQQQAYASGSAQQAVKGAVAPQDVVAMCRAGLSEEVIVTHVRSNGVTQTLQVNDLIYLRNQGVPDSVLQAMQTAPTSQARYQSAYTAAIPAPPAPPPVIVEHVYGPRYYAPPPYYWHGYHHPHYHHHHGHAHRGSNVHWGISIGR